MILRISLFITVLSCWSASVYAQGIQPCGTDHGDQNISHNSIHVQWAQEYYGQGIDNKSGGPIYLPITFQLVADDNGIGRVPEITLPNRLCALNQNFAPSGIQFYIKEITHIDDTNANTGADNQQSQSLGQYRRPNTINIFIAAEAKSGPTVVCGYYAGGAIWGNPGNPDILVVGRGCFGVNGTTLTHEMGHFLSLPHTFFGWEGWSQESIGSAPSWAEKVDGSNCTTAGDGVCDTEPDYVSDRWTCDTAGLSPLTVYNDGLQRDLIDPNGIQFRAFGKYYMSYSNDACTSEFSPGQGSKMRNYILNSRANLINNNTPPPDIAPTGPAVAVSPVPGGTTPYYNVAQLTWHSVPGATHYGIDVHRNTPGGTPLILVGYYITTDTTLYLNDLTPNTGYTWKVLPYNYMRSCEPFTTAGVFTTSNLFNSTETEQLLSNDLTLYPNPADEVVYANITTVNSSDYAMSITSLDGKVATIQNGFLSAGTQTLTISISELPQGLYMVSIKTKDGVLVRKLSKN